MGRLTEVMIRWEKTADGYRQLKARIAEDGGLMLEGCDAGKDVERLFGDWDFEYWLSVGAEFKDTVLLQLVKDRFTSAHELREWLEANQIPSTFTSY